ncbi:hypothetical protein ACN2C6_19235 (plasmid) [Caulobacter sp. ErkDOM-YI]|uniref:hypothetical protein n=1 Tax=unclassified Caulobacter TaxID=2648921 RepID=UPI003AF45568
MPIVFDDIDRDHQGPPTAGETHFSYLNRSGRIEAERVRALVEDWISRYPASDLTALVARLRSSIDAAHYSAFFELTVHELLVQTGHMIVAVEPEVPNSNHRPDFLVEAPNGARFYLEVVTSIAQTPQDVAADKRLNDAMGIVDNADAKLFFLDVEIEGKPSQQVSAKALRPALGAWIAALPATEAVRDEPPFVYAEYGMTLTISAFLRRTPREDVGGAIGVQNMEPYWGTPGDGIRESVEKKASRYGDLDIPYVVAVNAMSDYKREEDAIDAMFGSPCVVVRRYDDGRTETAESRNNDGVWQGEKGPRKKGLSAILSTERLMPWSVGQRRARLIRNPWATHPLPPLPLGVDELNPIDGKLDKTNGQSFAELFNLPPSWPED